MQSNWGHGARKSSSWAQGVAAVGAILAASAGGSALAAPTETVLHSFTGGADGSLPVGGVIRDFFGNLYGTTARGGQLTGCSGVGCGVVYKLSPNSTETVLHAFTGGADGANPLDCLIRHDSFGDFFGTTSRGGTSGNGVAFKLSPDGTETVLHSFSGSPSDGSDPEAGLTFGRYGNLWGTTQIGGQGAAPGNGVVFRIAPDGTETVRHFFAGTPDGAIPAGNLLHRDGHFFGTTLVGGANGFGEVFKIAPNGVKTTLFDFTGGADGANPQGSLLADRWGNLFGTASAGGAVTLAACPGGCGVVYKLSPPATAGGPWTEKVLYTFMGGPDGNTPAAGLLRDCKRNLYSTTTIGGAVSAPPVCAARGGCGVVFKLSPDGTETVLYTFQGGPDGDLAGAPLIADRESGNLFSTTLLGGTGPGLGKGVVFELTGTGFATEDECEE